MHPLALGVILTYECNISCSHCCFGCGKRGSGIEGLSEGIQNLSEELLMKVIEQASRIPHFKVVSFTGGEPTLRYDLLLKALGQAKKNGFNTRLVTNASWAKNPHKARSTLSELKEAGLDEINVTYDDFHSPFVPLSAIRNLYKASSSLGMRIAFAIVKQRSSVINKEYLMRMLKIEESKLGNEVFFIEDNVVPTGRGEMLNEDCFFYKNESPSEGYTGCPFVGTHLTVVPDGKIISCCGTPHREIPELEAGDLQTDSLFDIVERNQKDMLLLWLSIIGPVGIMRRIGMNSKKGYANICHACKVLFTDPANRNVLEHYVKEKPAEIILNDILLNDNMIKIADKLMASPETRARAD